MQTETWQNIRIHKVRTSKYINARTMHEAHNLNSFFQELFSIFANRIYIPLLHPIIPLVPELRGNIFEMIILCQFINVFYAAERDDKCRTQPRTIMNKPFK